MTRRSRERNWIAMNPPVGWQMLFMPKPNSGYREMCVICGTSGIGGSYLSKRPVGWQINCILGHEHQCDGCGAKFSSGAGLAGHRQCRSGHGDCCSCHVSTQHRRLQEVLATL